MSNKTIDHEKEDRIFKKAMWTTLALIVVFKVIPHLYDHLLSSILL